MRKRNPRRTDEEWINLIQECRSSGLSDKCWCEEHHIHTSNFYYQIRRLRKKACRIPEPVNSSFSKKQEVVQVSLDDAVQYPALEKTAVVSTSFEPAVRITAHGFQIEITNAAAEETVFRALSVLQRLC